MEEQENEMNEFGLGGYSGMGLVGSNIDSGLINNNNENISRSSIKKD